MSLFRNDKFRNKSALHLVAVLALSISLSGVELSAQEHGDSRWVSTWATSPSTVANSAADPAAVENQTLRLIVHSSVGGSSLRLRLSNTHGDRAMKIAATSVALHAEGASIRPGSSQSLRFGGQAEVIIPRGATVISDPIDFMVPELTNLAVSLYLPENSGFLTAHALANQTNYISESGNHVASINLLIEAETTAWNLLTATDVINNYSVSSIAIVVHLITD